MVVGTATPDSIRVEDYLQVPLPEGAMINGIITDVDAMTDFLDAIAKEHHLRRGATGSNALLSAPSRIIIQASNIMTKIMEVPPVDEAQIREFVKREFTQYEDTSDLPDAMLYDYTVLNQRGPGTGVELLAASASSEMIEDYRRAFEQATYNIEQIGIGVEAIIKLVSMMPELVGKTYLLTQVEPSRQTSTLFIDGTYRLFNGYRLTNKKGSDAWINEVGQNLASMLQFSRAQRGQAEVAQVSLAGLAPGDLERLKLEFGYLNVSMSHFDLSRVVTLSDRINAERLFDPAAFLFNLGALAKRT